MKRLYTVLAIALAMGCNSGTSGDEGGDGGSGGGEEGGQGGGDEGGQGGSETGGKGGSSKGGTGGSSKSGGTGGSSKGGSGGSTDKGGTGGTSDKGGSGGTMTGGTGGMVDPNVPAAPGCNEFKGTVHDFTSKHSDFQRPFDGMELMESPGTGLVMAELGADKKPVFVGTPGAQMIASANSFKEWWNDTAGVNMSTTVTLMHRKRSAVLYEFGGEGAEGDFTPIDDKLFGNIDFVEGGSPVGEEDKAKDAMHNHLFTLEIHAEFVYQGGKNEIIISESDDDSWVFINGKLAIDNGGLHGFSPASVTLDGMAAMLGLEKGKRYPISFFFADRHAGGARYRVSSNLIFTKCGQ